MRKSVFLFAVMATLSSSAFASDVWYGGDFDGRNGYFSNLGPDLFGFEGICYDDFTWNSANPAGHIHGSIFADGATNMPVYWEIRSGMSTSGLGTLVASGDSAATFTNIGNAFGFNVFDFQANIGPVALTNGNTYWLGVATDTRVGGNGSEIGAIGTTSGVGGVGSPLLNHNALQWDANANTIVDSQDDLSLGISAAAVPEPASMAALGLGVAALLRRRKK